MTDMHNITMNPMKDTINDMTNMMQINQAKSSTIEINILRT